jgi:hypothetical protein
MDPLQQFMVIAAAEFDDLGSCLTTPKSFSIGTIYSYKAIKANNPCCLSVLEVQSSESGQDTYTLAHERFTGLFRECNLRTHEPVPRRSKAALLEFLPTATVAWVVSPEAFERILKALAAGTISLSLLPPPLLVLAVLLGEAVPSGQLFDGITEKRILVIIWTPGFAGPLDSPSEILLEIVESKNVAVNEAPVESLLD